MRVPNILGCQISTNVKYPGVKYSGVKSHPVSYIWCEISPVSKIRESSFCYTLGFLLKNLDIQGVRTRFFQTNKAVINLTIVSKFFGMKVIIMNQINIWCWKKLAETLSNGTKKVSFDPYAKSLSNTVQHASSTPLGAPKLADFETHKHFCGNLR